MPAFSLAITQSTSSPPAITTSTHVHAPPAGVKDYANAAVITLGCTLFLMTGSIKSKHAGADSSFYGIMLMLGYLGFDGFTSTFQDKLFKVRGPTPRGRYQGQPTRWSGLTCGGCGRANED